MSVPADVAARHVPPLLCYYCKLGIAADRASPTVPGKEREVLARITAHDSRGCHHACFGHATWRLEHAFGFGHSPDCPYWRAK